MDLQRNCAQELAGGCGSGEWGKWSFVKGLEAEDAIDEDWWRAVELGF